MTQTDKTRSDLTNAVIDPRVVFHDDDQIMEVDFCDFNFVTPQDANRFYDRIEERIAQTGEEQWFSWSTTRARASKARRGSTFRAGARR